jgi:hypothetical protein
LRVAPQDPPERADAGRVELGAGVVLELVDRLRLGPAAAIGRSDMTSNSSSVSLAGFCRMASAIPII